jgi:hypothetical protein
VLEADEVAAIEEVQGWAAGLGALHTRVTADEAYGGDPALRGWLEDRGLSSVLAVKCTSRCGRPPRVGAGHRHPTGRPGAGRAVGCL